MESLSNNIFNTEFAHGRSVNAGYCRRFICGGLVAYWR